MITGNGSVDLSGRQISVSQKILDGSKIGAPFQEMGSKAVTKGMRERGHPPLDYATDAPRVERPAPDSHPESIARFSTRKLGTARDHISTNRLLSRSTYRYPPGLVSLANDGDQLAVGLSGLQRGQLGYTETGGIEGVQDCSVSKTLRRAGVD